MRPSREKPTFIHPRKLGRARPMKVSSSRLMRIITGALAFFERNVGIIIVTPPVILLPNPPPVCGVSGGSRWSPFQGEPILAVAAVDELTAADAIEKIQIDFELWAPE